ncbi:tail fiber domain-containing protein [Hymenobacter ruricola]|uniref:Peptidase S74 domain-containing protein n=1 Tax=Hymenobacter ruricola TaxID=2791023 RepID=A0ABS0I7X5_9BACT|nr:tail fiber domain-containing protein [Hymenobacter ruricola]MBF9223012.1 hypothetical protein [Hymenobacter ruricola]
MSHFLPLRRAAAPLLLAAASLTAQAQSTGLGIGIATPRAGLDVDHNNGVLSTGTFGTGTIPVQGAGTRLLWYPAKGAFRAGTVDNFANTLGLPAQTNGGTASTWWDDANTGNYSAAFGYACRASGDYSLAAGYGTSAAQTSAFAYGYECTASGAASVALGYGAHTNARQGSFVFADRSSTGLFRAPVNHSANWRVTGGFRVVTDGSGTDSYAPARGVSILPSSGTGGPTDWGQFASTTLIATSTGAYLSNGGTWTNSSDRHKKHRFEAVSGEDVLRRLRQVPITRWSYKADAPSVRHLGPMAQDFRNAFGLGADSVSIGTVDADGVALVGVQALEARTRAQAAEITALRARLEALERRAATPATGFNALAQLPLAAGLLGAGLVLAFRRRRKAA